LRNDIIIAVTLLFLTKPVMTTHQLIAVVCNPAAGKGKAFALCNQLVGQLTSRNISFTLFTYQWPDQFQNFTHVFIVGGDGTLNYFVNKYPGIKLPLSIFKGGSGNDFAWKLYGNCSLTEQLERVLRSEPVAVDAGVCNGRYFLNGVGIGFDGEVVKAMGKKRVFAASHLAYLWTVLMNIAFYREIEVQIEYEGRQRNEKLFMISIANASRYGGGFLVAPQANITDGYLDIVIIKCIHRLTRIFHLPKVEKGKHLHLSFVESGLVQKICIRSKNTVAAHIDGELLETTNFSIEILPAQFLFR
jgi:diacylglycerol kinase (ATP)